MGALALETDKYIIIRYYYRGVPLLCGCVGLSRFCAFGFRHFRRRISVASHRRLLSRRQTVAYHYCRFDNVASVFRRTRPTNRFKLYFTVLSPLQRRNDVHIYTSQKRDVKSDTKKLMYCRDKHSRRRIWPSFSTVFSD